MPINANTFNARLTSEALEKKFRDTFTSQGGAELISDLYAQGTIVPVVDFTDSALGSVLRSDLQKAWDISTGRAAAGNSTTTGPNTSGFWRMNIQALLVSAAGSGEVFLAITDGSSTKVIWEAGEAASTGDQQLIIQDEFIVFLKAGESVTITATSGQTIWTHYRQIADVYGNLTNPSGFVSQ